LFPLLKIFTNLLTILTVRFLGSEIVPLKNGYADKQDKDGSGEEVR